MGKGVHICLLNQQFLSRHIRCSIELVHQRIVSWVIHNTIVRKACRVEGFHQPARRRQNTDWLLDTHLVEVMCGSGGIISGIIHQFYGHIDANRRKIGLIYFHQTYVFVRRDEHVCLKTVWKSCCCQQCFGSCRIVGILVLQ